MAGLAEDHGASWASTSSWFLQKKINERKIALSLLECAVMRQVQGLLWNCSGKCERDISSLLIMQDYSIQRNTTEDVPVCCQIEVLVLSMVCQG